MFYKLLRPLLFAMPPAKLAPDLGDEQLDAIASFAAEHLIDGVIATNTTTSRPADSPLRDEAGGMSGAPLHALSVAVVAKLRRLLPAHFPIVGVGGIIAFLPGVFH